MSRYRHADNLTGIIAMALHQYEHPLDPNKMTASEINGMPSAIVLRYQNDPKFNAWVKSIVARVLTEEDATIARLTRELEEARRWVNDLQSGMYINCVYCGHRYGPKDKVPCTMADALKQHIEQCPKHPMSSLRAELADLKDGLTAAHMDGFASGKAEAKEMLRKREGQLEELRAEVKAYREVEDSLQKEIKRLDKEVASLTQELEEARSMIQWERGAKNGAYELIEQQDKLKAENAALREEVRRLKVKLERWKIPHTIEELTEMKEQSNQPSLAAKQAYINALEWHFSESRARAEQAEKELAAERGKSKCNHEWKEWTSTAGRTRQCIKCGQQYSWFG